MLFRDMELDFDIFDADTAELYEEAAKRAGEEAAKKPRGDPGRVHPPSVPGRFSTSSTPSLARTSTGSFSVSAPTWWSAWRLSGSLLAW